MHPVREDEDDALARLESRIEQVAATVAQLRDRNSQLESLLKDADSQREAALRDAEESRRKASALAEEVEALRNRQKEAAARVKSLLSQMEQFELPSDR
jgi:chromosome segregation ATPase